MTWYCCYKSGDSNKPIRFVLLIFALIFFIIGCSTWFSGCDPDLQPYCTRFYVKDTSVIDYTVSTRSCSECISSHQECTDDDDGRSCRTVCDTYNYWTSSVKHCKVVLSIYIVFIVPYGYLFSAADKAVV